MKLSNMPLNKEAVITKVGGEGILRNRLLDMGLIPRTRVHVCHVAPLGDPIEIRLRDYTLTLRREDADNIEVAQHETETECMPCGTVAMTGADSV
jgi:Fe2+ transport system protein FeoA